MQTFVRSARSRAALALVAVGLGTAVIVAGCGGGSGSGSASGGNGTLQMSLTDAPACGYDSVNVTVQKVRVNQSSTAADTDGGWSEIVLSPPKRVDLLTLSNGVLADLGQTPLPAGKYTQMRLVLAANDSTAPFANSVVPTGAQEVALTTPSGQQSGVKMNVDIDVAADQLADFVIDFNACKSIVRAGASGKYLLKPVVSVTPHFISGMQGFVDASLVDASTAVSLQQAGVVVKSSTPDSSGKFTLAPVAPGTYDLVMTSTGHATAVVTDVVIATDTVTALNGAASALNPPASPSGTAAGSVAVTGATSIDATAKATQLVSTGHTVEVAGGPVDAVSGAYSYALATAAPVVAPYVAAPGTLSFTASAPAAGQYGFSASSGGATKTAGPLAIAAGATTTVPTFTFP